MTTYPIILLSLLTVALLTGLVYSIKFRIEEKRLRARRTSPLRNPRPTTTGAGQTRTAPISSDSHRPFGFLATTA